jgi:hypothetical protein
MGAFIASMILLKANTDRITRKAEQAVRDELFAQKNKDPEQASDWLERFSQPTQQPEVASSLHVQKEHFEQAFSSRAGVSQPATEPMEPTLRDAATTVLETHDTSKAKMGADTILGVIQEQGIATPHSGNESLEPKPSETEMTTRHDPQQMLGEEPTSDTVAEVPLPDTVPTMVDLDDLDI